MANRVATILGVVFLLVGVLGFLAPNLLGAHLSTLHNIVHLVSGAISLFVGLKVAPSGAKMFCLLFGIVYGLLGVIGFVSGEGAGRVITIAPGLELGTMDHVIHILFGVVYILGGLLTKAVLDRRETGVTA